MKAAIFYKLRDIRIKDVKEPKVRPGCALIKVKAVGICRSDVHYYTQGRIGSQIIKKPLVLGHEAAGLVVETGKGVTNIKKGDRVSLEPGIFCGKCPQCRTGRPNLCKKVRFFGTPPINGTFLEYVVHPAGMLFKLPERLSYGEGALIEPLTVGMYAVELAKIKTGETVAILGAGPIGLSILKSALCRKVKHIYVTDYLAYRLKYAAKHKKVTVVNAGAEPVKKILRMTKGRGVDVVFEAAGKAEAVKQTIEVAATGGRVVWAGIPDEDTVTIDCHEARRRELLIINVRRTKHQNEKAVRALASGKIYVKDMVTHRFPLKDITKAFQLVEKYKDGVIKAVIEM